MGSTKKVPIWRPLKQHHMKRARTHYQNVGFRNFTGLSNEKAPLHQLRGSLAARASINYGLQKWKANVGLQLTLMTGLYLPLVCSILRNWPTFGKIGASSLTHEPFVFGPAKRTTRTKGCDVYVYIYIYKEHRRTHTYTQKDRQTHTHTHTHRKTHTHTHTHTPAPVLHSTGWGGSKHTSSHGRVDLLDFGFWRLPPLKKAKLCNFGGGGPMCIFPFVSYLL